MKRPCSSQGASSHSIALAYSSRAFDVGSQVPEHYMANTSVQNDDFGERISAQLTRQRGPNYPHNTCGLRAALGKKRSSRREIAQCLKISDQNACANVQL